MPERLGEIDDIIMMDDKSGTVMEILDVTAARSDTRMPDGYVTDEKTPDIESSAHELKLKNNSIKCVCGKN